ncbi:hypothetical protein AGDE_13456 [Angomonas deanei]|uniref:Uncharacterized protein n=1 Tax=Angomonas deanei TaxID=59799 RepID=A0A7G2CJC3_9TRYP|nr:hypothetical protein AGDE_13456 [Angomonas deanei]CAD2219958.1 hypothetical protein, conserved [Angomonas deanei]|eukprot:EPY22282.1 hypothetical protein AGDE_13456 [Angomonas deanei]
MELLTVIVFNLVLILHNKAKLARYFESICGVLCTSLSKTLARNEVNFRRAMTILCDDDASTFKALPDDADASMRATFKHLYCTVVGRLYESVGAKADGAKQAAVVESFLVDILERLLAEGDCKNMCYLLRETRRYKPSEKFATAVVQYVVKFIQSEELRDQDQEAAEVNRSLVPIALGWGYPELSQRITEATKADNVQESVKGAITEHYLQSFENTMTFLCTSCEEAQFDDIKCALEGIAKNKHSLGEEEIQLIERAVLMSLTAAATSLGDKGDSEEASEATESTDSENDDSESLFQRRL